MRARCDERGDARTRRAPHEREKTPSRCHSTAIRAKKTRRGVGRARPRRVKSVPGPSSFPGFFPRDNRGRVTMRGARSPCGRRVRCARGASATWVRVSRDTIESGRPRSRSSRAHVRVSSDRNPRKAAAVTTIRGENNAWLETHCDFGGNVGPHFSLVRIRSSGHKRDWAVEKRGDKRSGVNHVAKTATLICDVIGPRR